MNRKEGFFFAFLSALLFSLSGPLFGFWPVIFFSLAPLVYALAKLEKGKDRFLTVYFFGALVLFVQYLCIFDLLPLDWIGITNDSVGFLVAVFLWLLLSLFLSISFLVLPLSWQGYFSSKGFTPFLMFAFLWPLSEMLRSFLYALLVLGPGGSLGDHFSYGFTAYHFSQSQFFLFLSPLLGSFGLSFLVSLSAALIVFVFLHYEKSKSLPIITTFLICLSILFVFPVSLSAYPSDVKKINTLIVQADNPVSLGYDDAYFEGVALEYKRAISDGLEKYPETDLVVLPENTGFLSTLSKKENISLGDVSKEVLGTNRARLLVYGDYDVNLRESVVSLATNTGDDVKILRKSLLMPLGEYQPYLLWFLANISGGGEWFENLSLYRSTKEVWEETKSFKTVFGPIAAAACSEILSKGVYDKIEEDSPVLIIHQQRLAPFHKSTHVFKYFLAASQFKAAHLRTPIVGSVDGGGYSYSIKPNGALDGIGSSGDDYIFAEILISE